MLLQCLLLMLFVPGNSDVEILKVFEPLEKHDEFISNPYSAHFSPDGKLFVIDRYQAKVFVWSKDGTFLRTFGSKGQGPGEMQEPVKVFATKDLVYIWQTVQMMSVYKHDGTFVETFPVPGLQPRNFSVREDGSFVVLYRHTPGPTEALFVFREVDKNGKPGKIIKQFSKELLAPIEGDNNTRMKAYGPDGDIQSGPDGKLRFGFSQNRTLYTLDGKGGIESEQVFKLTTDKPDDEERKVVENMVFFHPQGGYISLKELPNIKMDFSYDKAFYTHFLLKEDKALFVLTPTGGFNGVGNGYSTASYVVADAKSGNLVGRGRYAFPQDTVLLYRDGRIIAFMMDEEESYVVKELTLKHF